jgi:hypothetical protein
MKIMNFAKKALSVVAIIMLVVISIVPAAMAQGTLPTVENLKVKEAGNRFVTLSWDPVAGATGYVLLYGTAAVTGPDQEYNRPPVELENVTEHRLENLVNGTTYYFSVYATTATATSAELSEEVSATPTAAGDAAAPTITGVVPVTSTEFTITFSKAMSFPANAAQEINIVKTFDNSALRVVSAERVDATSLKVTTDAQDEGSEYRISLSGNFRDSSGVAIEEVERGAILIGASSVNLFDDLFGAAGEPSDVTIDEIVVIPDNRAIEVIFSKGIQLSETPLRQIAIVKTAEPTTSSVNVVAVEKHPTENNKILVAVEEPFENVSYTVLFIGIQDSDGLVIAEANSTKNFTAGQATALRELLGEVTGLQARFLDVAELLARLTWGANADLEAGLVAAYKIYVAEGSTAEFRLLSEVEPSELSFDTESLSPADLYRFRVTTVDAEGNESEGAIAELELPGVGPAGLIMLALGSLGLGSVVTRRRR